MIPRFNLANRVTLLRLLFAVVACLILLAIQEGLLYGDAIAPAAWTALAFFAIATASDALDGYIARRENTVTAFGRIADPFVDKIVVCGSLVILIAIPQTAAYVRPWMVVLILFREFLVTGIRGYMESRGIDFGAEMPGKIKMVVQSFLTGFAISVLGFQPEVPDAIGLTTHVLAWATVLLTVYSGTLYVVRASKHLGGQDI